MSAILFEFPLKPKLSNTRINTRARENSLNRNPALSFTCQKTQFELKT